MKFILPLLLILVLILPSCTENKPPPCRDVLESLIQAERGLPAGKIYNLSAEKGSVEYLPDRLLNSLFGNGEKPPMRDGWIDAALFLPTSAHPCEFAVILCDTPNCAVDTARMLLHRLDIIRTSKPDSEYSAILNNATVTVMGNYVLLLISSDTENAVTLAFNVTKGN